MIKRTLFFGLSLLVMLGSCTAWYKSVSALSGSDWQAGNILDDSIFTDASSMSVQQIQDFITSKINANGGCDTDGSKPASDWGRSDLTHAQFAQQVQGWPGPPYVCLNEYYEVPKTTPSSGVPDNSYNHYDANSHTLQPVPGGISAAQIIYNAAQQYQISPKVILVKIQTESAGPLTQDTWPLQSQYTYALGSNCPDSGPGGSAQCDTNYSGFSMQVYSAASLLRSYLTNMQQPWWTHARPYQTNSVLWNVSQSGCGAGNVYVNTMASAALYTYTPYQPNGAALAKLSDTSTGGTGDSCSAYGNRNFWWWFSHWFGNPAYPPSPAYIPDGTYNVTGTGSGKNVDVSGGSSTPGARVQLYDNNGTGAQKWTFTRDAEGYYTIKNAASGEYLDVTGASTVPGTKLQIWDGNTSCAQKWAAQIIGTGYAFLNTCSGLALDATGGNTSNGTPLQTYTKNSTPSQIWTLRSIDPPLVSTGLYNLLTSSGTALDISGGATTAGTPMQIYTRNDTGAQAWLITRQSNGLYTLYNPQSGRFLDVTGGSSAAGTRVQIWDGAQTCAQEWAITTNSDSSFGLTSACSGLRLDVYGGTTSTNGTPVDIWDNNGTNAQKWTLVAANGIVADGKYSLLSATGAALDIPGGSTASGTRMQIYSKNGTGAQQWQIARQSNGLYELLNPQSGKYLDVVGGSTTAGTRVQIWDGNHTCAQQWALTLNGDGSYGLTSSCSGLRLDIYGGATSMNGTPVDAWSNNGTNAQRWTLSPSS